jgi:hypothetical protein
MKIWTQLNMSPLSWMVTDVGESSIKNLEI